MSLDRRDSKNKINNDRYMVVVPDDFSEIDRIGYNEHSAGLIEMIRSVQAKGALLPSGYSVSGAREKPVCCARSKGS